MIFKEKVLDKIIYLLFLSLFIFTPLIMTSHTSELFEFNKIIFIYLVTTTILFCWILKMILLKKIIFRGSPFDVFLFLFLFSQIISTFFSIDKHTSFFGYYGRFNGGLLSLFAYIILYYAFIANIKKEKIEKFLKFSLITSLIVIFWGLPGKIGFDLSCLVFTGQLNNSCWTDQFRPHERMFSTLGQPNWLGAYLAVNFFIAIYFFLTKKNKMSYWFYFLYLLLNFTGILFTRSRSAILAIVSIMPLFVFFNFFFHFKNYRFKNLKAFFSQILFLFLIILIPILFFKTGIEKVDRYLNFEIFSKKNVNQIKATDDLNQPIKVTESLDIRKIVWQGAIELGKKYPLFGSGVETFGYAYYFVRPKEHNLTSEWDYLYNRAHNEFLNYLATTGFFGLGSYLLLIISVVSYTLIKVFRKKDKNNFFLPIFLIFSYLSILITNFFGFSTTTINLFFYLIPGFIFILSNEQLENDFNFEKKIIDVNLINKFLILAISFIFVYILFFIIKYWYADVLYAKGDIHQRSGYYQDAVEYLQKALKFKYEHLYEDKISFSLASLAYSAYYDQDKKTAYKLIKLSQFYNNHSLKVSPLNVIYYKTKAKNNYLFYQITLDKSYLIEGLRSLETAFNLSPTDPKIPYTQAIFYSLLYDEEKNKENKEKLIKKIYDSLDFSISLKQDFRDSYFFKGKFLKNQGKKEEAKKIFQYILQNINPNDQEVKEEINSL